MIIQYCTLHKTDCKYYRLGECTEKLGRTPHTGKRIAVCPHAQRFDMTPDGTMTIVLAFGRFNRGIHQLQREIINGLRKNTK